MLKLRNSFKGHTVFTSQITAVCDGNSKIVNVTLVIINQPVHNKLTPSDIDKKIQLPNLVLDTIVELRCLPFQTREAWPFQTIPYRPAPLEDDSLGEVVRHTSIILIM
jgi:hypothetical protein